MIPQSPHSLLNIIKSHADNTPYVILSNFAIAQIATMPRVAVSERSERNKKATEALESYSARAAIGKAALSEASARDKLTK